MKEIEIKQKIDLDDIYKQSYLVMSNINATKVKYKMDEKDYQTLIDSHFILQGMFNEYVKNKIENA